MPFSSDPETLSREGVTAEAIGLVRSDPSKPGWTRRRCGTGFTYKDDRGQTLKGTRAERCRALVLPPAWDEIWICPHPRGHIQATGRDEAGRLQYRYHPTWSAARNSAKFDDLIAFGHALPELRRRVRHDLTYSDCPRALRLAAIVRLLDRGALRIGRSGRKTYGAVSLRKSHVQIDGHKIICAYKGKGGTPRRVIVKDKLLAKTLDGLMAERGAFLFRSRKVRPAAQDVNAYIQETLGLSFTAKDFRTWKGSVAAVDALTKAEDITIKAITQAAANVLGNTPAIAKSSYIHPVLLDLARDKCRPDQVCDEAESLAGEDLLLAVLEAVQPLA
ncbi:MAG: DNA topoisomerase IB [Hyphomonas sp.]|uniref:DNA topoisomerase IB n=1 Tax=unclassified Hyphomonas TaxID=2630699 RepID=UPI001A8D6D9F|nr:MULTISPECIES: DNA topoisomerase IB [unclassified Hyphomonas]MBO6581897.1 DNA topoisomerase IB [Hyphomonas sp.]QSR23203.1 DNA topoisomerase [Hyphomonas sp. KY3]